MERVNLENNLEQKKYFTIKSNKNGFGDFFITWLPLYNLITGMDFTYIHTPLDLIKKHTTKNPKEIEDCVGFDCFKNKIENFEDYEKYPVDISKMIKILKKRNFIENLNEYLEEITKKEKRILLFDLEAIRRKNWKMHIRRITLEKPELKNPLLETYLKKTNKNPPLRNMKSDKTNIVIHIRRGDVVKVKINGEDKYALGTGASSIKYIPVKYYILMLDKIIKEKGEDNCNIFVFSDGNKKALKRFERKLAPEEYKKVLQMNLDNEFKEFSKYKNINLYIGDNIELFKKCFYGLTHGDIIICGWSAFVRASNYFIKEKNNQQRYFVKKPINLKNENPLLEKMEEFNLKNKPRKNRILKKFKNKIIQIKTTVKLRNLKYTPSCCTVTRLDLREIPYLDSFIKYYQDLGVTKMYFFNTVKDNGELRNYFEKFEKDKSIELFDAKNEDFKKGYFKLSKIPLEKIKEDYILNCDCDEFLVLESGKNICKFLKETCADYYPIRWRFIINDKEKKNYPYNYVTGTIKKYIIKRNKIKVLGIHQPGKINGRFEDLKTHPELTSYHFWSRTFTDTVLKCCRDIPTIIKFKTCTPKDLRDLIIKNEIPFRIKVLACLSNISDSSKNIAKEMSEVSIDSKLEREILEKYLSKKEIEKLGKIYLKYKQKLKKKLKKDKPLNPQGISIPKDINQYIIEYEKLNATINGLIQPNPKRTQ